MKRIFVKISLISLVIVFAVLLSSCSNTMKTFQPEITSRTDNFQLHSKNVKDRTTTINYNWNNTGSGATVNHSAITDSGTARLIIRDSKNTVVYDRKLSPSLSEPTAIGHSGTWTVSLVLDQYSGTPNFKIQRL
jgi:predicted small secreted protein